MSYTPYKHLFEIAQEIANSKQQSLLAKLTVLQMVKKFPATCAVVVAPDDGHEDARNMLSCI
jgi:hypothetical protein